MASKWYLALIHLDFPAFAKELDKEDLAQPTIPYASANVLDPSPLYHKVAAKLPHLVQDLPIPAWYVLYLQLEEETDPRRIALRSHFRREAQLYFDKKGVDAGKWFDVVHRAMRQIKSA